MKKKYFALLFALFISSEAFMQEYNKRIFDTQAGQEILINQITREGLVQEPFGTWFNKGYQEYEPEQEVIDKLLQLRLDDIKIIIVLGTWCGDSKREVPRFFKILDEIAFPEENLHIIAVNRLKEAETFSMEELAITHVPTFIIENNGFETGRITEFPEETLEKDFLKIISE
jgi:thiol-disulfide isomerase/thioredoxin